MPFYFDPNFTSRVITTDYRYNQTVIYDSFYGLPFAAPPTGVLPPLLPRRGQVRPPGPGHPLEGGPGRHEGREPGALADSLLPGEPPPPPQVVGLIPFSSEDCLYLNVHVPVVVEEEEEEEEGLAVMVWLTGGAFALGGGPWYGPDYWMGHGIILVTVNYRVGPAGFLTLGMEEAPGNAGLWDQAAALAWVQENIREFGGDPDRVTLAGESAGSFSSFYQLSSPTSRGLFHRVIGQSGVGGVSPGYHHWSPEEGFRLGTEAAVLLGCPQIDPGARLACLRWPGQADYSTLPPQGGLLRRPQRRGLRGRDHLDAGARLRLVSKPLLPYRPGPSLGGGLLRHHGDMNSADTTVCQVDILLGSNAHEGLLFTQVLLTMSIILLSSSSTPSRPTCRLSWTAGTSGGRSSCSRGSPSSSAPRTWPWRTPCWTRWPPRH